MDYLYQYYKDNLEEKYEDEFELVFMKNTKVQGKLAKFLFSLRKFHVVVSDYPTKLFKNGKTSFFVCHGYGTKRTPGKDEIKDQRILNIYKDLKNTVQYIVTLSKRDETYFLKEEALKNTKEPRYIPLGLPRNDILFTESFVKQSNKEVRDMLKVHGKKIILFCPTWRGYKIEKTFPLIRKDFESLNEYMRDNNYVLLYRPHPIEGIFSEALIEGLDNIILASSKEIQDTQKLLCATDLLITDYSSIYVDYLALNRPMSFIPFDYEQYDENRGLVVDFRDNIETPGPKIEKLEDLTSYLSELSLGEDSYEHYRHKSRHLFHAYLDNNSCKRIWDFIISNLKEN